MNCSLARSHSYRTEINSQEQHSIQTQRVQLRTKLRHRTNVLSYRWQKAILVQDFHPVTSLADIRVAVESDVAIVVTETTLRDFWHAVILHGLDDGLLHQRAVLRQIGSRHSGIAQTAHF